MFFLIIINFRFKMASSSSFLFSFRHLNLIVRNQHNIISRPIFNFGTRSSQTLNVPGSYRCFSLLIKPNQVSRFSILSRGVHTEKGEKSKLSLADEILSARVAETQKSEEKSEGKPQEPMPRWQKYGYIFLGVLMGGSLIGNAVLFSLPDQDEHGNNVEDEFSNLTFPSQYYHRLKNKIFTTKKLIEEPFSDKLLPDPLEPPYYQPKYTIVLGKFT